MIAKLEDIQLQARKSLYSTGALELPSAVIEHELTLGLYTSLQELIPVLGGIRSKFRNPDELRRIAYLYSIKKLPLRGIADRVAASRETVRRRLKEMNIEVERPSLKEKTQRRRAKANAHYRCQECGATELIQTHHSIPGDDSTIVVLCAECHSRKHPDVPKALFLSVIRQSYWFNKSAASLARELGVHPRTVIRAARGLEILPGELSSRDEELIRNNIPKLQWKQKARKPCLLLPKKAAAYLGLTIRQLYETVRSGKITPVVLRHRRGSQEYFVEYFDRQTLTPSRKRKATQQQAQVA